VPGFSPGEGKGASKRDAEQAAAAAMLARESVFKAEEKAAKQDV
jgi:dsRNA-specific ribonuclease